MIIGDSELSGVVLSCAYTVHSNLGPGLLESVCQTCLAHELIKTGRYVEVQKALPVVYDDRKLSCGFRLDIVLERRLVVEVKSVEALAPIHLAQIMTYLKIGGYPVGLLLNFNVESLKHGIRRVINGP